MPELPEVEHVRRGLEREILKLRIRATWRSAFDLRTGAAWAREREHIDWLKGAQSCALRRRGKYILWDLRSERRGELTALLHLGMTGRFEIHKVGDTRVAHTHLALAFEDGRRLDYIDPRRFGGFVVHRSAELLAQEPIASLGPEPLGPHFDAVALQEATGSSRRVIRQALLDQKVVAGLGNIYVSEALFEAKIPPLARCNRLKQSAWTRLGEAIVSVLKRSLERGGTTLRDYRQVDGSRGSNQDSLRAYGRANLPCVDCAVLLQAHEVQGRTGVHCPRCQRSRPGGWIS